LAEYFDEEYRTSISVCTSLETECILLGVGNYQSSEVTRHSPGSDEIMYEVATFEAVSVSFMVPEKLIWERIENLTK